jgi:hypothetical protein
MPKALRWVSEHHTGRRLRQHDPGGLTQNDLPGGM